jgi:molybdenum cofactor cytidylyltransferase
VTTGALVLAAGVSRRFGSDKRRFLVDGEPLLRRTVARVLAAGLPCRVCLRPGDGDLPLWLDLPDVSFLECPGANRGMGATLAEGVARCDDWEALLVVLGDMAWTASATLAAVAASVTRRNIVQPTYRGRPGHPVAFGERFFPELRTLSGDRGGRDIIARCPDLVTGLPVDDPGIHRDLDFPAH